jgi:hypothetical protein
MGQPLVWSCPASPDTQKLAKIAGRKECWNAKDASPLSPRISGTDPSSLPGGPNDYRIGTRVRAVGADDPHVDQSGGADHAERPAEPATDKGVELARLWREVQQLRLERDILAKAAAWFARETESVPARSTRS